MTTSLAGEFYQEAKRAFYTLNPFSSPSKAYSHTFKLIDANSKLPMNCDKIRVTLTLDPSFMIDLGEHESDNGTIKLNYFSSNREHELIFDFYKKKGVDEWKGCYGDRYRIIFSTTIPAPKKINEDTEILIPRENDSLVSLRDPKKSAPFRANLHYTFDLFVKTIGPDVLKNYWIKGHGVKTIEELQNLFGFKSPNGPDANRSIDLALNGMANMTPALRNGPSGAEWVFEQIWGKKDLKKGANAPDIRDVQLIATKTPAQDLQCIRLEIKDPQTNIWKKYKPDTSEEFKGALRLFNASISFWGAVGPHLIDMHLLEERILCCMENSLQYNPIDTLLEPHTREVKDINGFGSHTIFDPQNGLVSIALDPANILEIIETRLNTLDWTWKPRDPVCTQDLAAHDDQLFYKMLEEVVNQFFTENESEIKTHWKEIHLLSKHLKADLKSFSTLTNSDAPQPGDMQNLKQFCVFFIFITTFGHTRRHCAQKRLENFDEIPLAPHNGGTGTFGGMTLDEARRVALVIDVLNKFKEDTLEENQYGDIYPYLLERYKQIKPQFKSYKGDVFAAINI